MPIELPFENVIKDDMCFACGQSNPVGLKMKFRKDGEQSRSEFTPEDVHCSWQGIFHGGLMTTILDEALGWVLVYHEIGALTAKMEVRFRRVVTVGQKLSVYGEIVNRTRKTVNVRSYATGEDGQIVAELEAVMFTIPFNMQTVSHSSCCKGGE